MASTSEDQPKPVTGYPPQMGYPPPAGCHDYTAATNGYAYMTQPPPPPPRGPYYPTQPYLPPPQRSPLPLLRRLLIILISFILIACMISLIIWLILRPQLPIFRLNSLSVSNFNTTNSKLTANWYTSITVLNPNHKLRVSFDRIESGLFYRDTILAVDLLNPFHLGTKEQKVYSYEFDSPSSKQPDVDNLLIEEMGRDQSKGNVSFSVRTLTDMTYKAGSWFTRHGSIRVFCEDIKIGFSPEGKPIDGGPIECIVYG